MPHIRSFRPSAFSLPELLVVLALISLLAALLFPAFLAVRGKARQSVCASNLRQIGLGLTMYQQDYDGYFPYAISPQDRVTTALWRPYFPQFAGDIDNLPLLHESLKGYVGSSHIFHCPGDIGFTAIEMPYVPLNAAPTSYDAFGTSYVYRSLLSACRTQDAAVRTPSRLGILYDPVGYWHGTLAPLEPRYNMLFADGHVKNLTGDQSNEVSGSSINQVPPSEFNAAQVCSF